MTPATQQLLRHWRHRDFTDVRPFFCQVEAVETAIWLTEVAQRETRYKRIWEHIKGANKDANPDLLRLALKMATGSGKTTVMAMLIAWQTVNAVRSPGSNLFSRGFLIITPGITIRDRLRVLSPDDADSYYRTRGILPADMLPDMGKAKIVITNYHAFNRRETVELSKVGRAFLQGRGEPISTIESEGKMLQRACEELLALKNVVVINDEAHHCYREKPDRDDEGDLKGEEKDEAKRNNEAARLWISGIEALKRKAGVRAVYDLSATPFFLRGSGYAEGTLVTYQAIADMACELIDMACQRAMGRDKGVKAVLDPYNPRGSTTHVSFNTTKELLWETAQTKCHVNYVVCDSAWEAELARVVEATRVSSPT